MSYVNNKMRMLSETSDAKIERISEISKLTLYFLIHDAYLCIILPSRHDKIDTFCTFFYAVLKLGNLMFCIYIYIYINFVSDFVIL